MKKNFLLYLLYATLLGIRERSYENNDKITFKLSDLLHNIPLRLISEEEGDKAYDDLLENIEALGMENWLNMRKEEFYTQFPEYKL